MVVVRFLAYLLLASVLLAVIITNTFVNILL